MGSNKIDRDERLKQYTALCAKRLTDQEIAKLLGVSTRTVYVYGMQTGIEPVSRTLRYEEFKRLCEHGLSQREIAVEMGMSVKTIRSYAKALGLVPRSDRRQPKLDVSFFDVIDTEEKAYILGFVAADGYIGSNARVLTIRLHKKDTDILERIRSALRCENAIHYDGKKFVTLNLSSLELVTALAKYGIVRAKSHVLPFPEIPQNLYRHFMRGFCDGDGHVGERQVAIVVGSFGFAASLESYLERKFGRPMSFRNYPNYRVLVLSRKDLDIVQWMYEDCSIFLKRKHDAYLSNWRSYAERKRSAG